MAKYWKVFHIKSSNFHFSNFKIKPIRLFIFRVAIVQYLTSHTPIELEFRIVATVNRLLNFLENHKCDYRTMYEDTYPEMFTNYTEPTDTPRKILEDFLYVVRSMGLWAADRATLVW